MHSGISNRSSWAKVNFLKLILGKNMTWEWIATSSMSALAKQTTTQVKISTSYSYILLSGEIGHWGNIVRCFLSLEGSIFLSSGNFRIVTFGQVNPSNTTLYKNHLKIATLGVSDTVILKQIWKIAEFFLKNIFVDSSHFMTKNFLTPHKIPPPSPQNEHTSFPNLKL